MGWIWFWQLLCLSHINLICIFASYFTLVCVFISAILLTFPLGLLLIKKTVLLPLVLCISCTHIHHICTRQSIWVNVSLAPSKRWKKNKGNRRRTESIARKNMKNVSWEPVSCNSFVGGGVALKKKKIGYWSVLLPVLLLLLISNPDNWTTRNDFIVYFDVDHSWKSFDI